MNYIYLFTNKINGKHYVGSTVSTPKHRYQQHMYWVNHPDNHRGQYPLYCAIRKYGIDNFIFEVIDQKECSEEQIRELEYTYIIKYNSLAPKGYNQTLNTEHPINDPLTYAKMKATKREKAKEVVEIDLNRNILHWWNSAIECAEETNINCSRICDVCKGHRHHVENHVFRYITTEGEVIEPIYTGTVYKGEKGTTQIQSKSRAVIKLDLNTKEELCEYSTIALAARENNLDNSGISKCCKGKRVSCGGFAWRYKDEIFHDKENKRQNKKVVQLDKDTNEMIMIYNSISEAAKAVNGDRGNISKVCHGQQKISSGYKWKFIDQKGAYI